MSNTAVLTESSTQLSVSLWLRFFSKVLVAATIGLIFMGALVTSHNAGLAVPDWPTTWGENMFLFPPSKWVGNIFFEHCHRIVASVIGLLTVILTISLWRLESRSWVKNLGYLSLFAVITQGVLGGITVLYFLPTPVSVGHALLGQTFFLITIVIAYAQSKEFETRVSSDRWVHSQRLFKLSLCFVALIYLQLILGATMRHTASGLAIPDFPSMGGSYIPWFDQKVVNSINELRAAKQLWPIEQWQVVLHFAHRATAFLVVGFVLYLSVKLIGFSRVSAAVKSTVLATLFLTAIQFILGILTVLSGKAPYITSLHVVLGAATLGAAGILALRTAPFEKEKR